MAGSPKNTAGARWCDGRPSPALVSTPDGGRCIDPPRPALEHQRIGVSIAVVLEVKTYADRLHVAGLLERVEDGLLTLDDGNAEAVSNIERLEPLPEDQRATAPLLRGVQPEAPFPRRPHDVRPPSTAEHSSRADRSSPSGSSAWHRKAGTPASGRGSNVLLTGDLPGLVLHLGKEGIEKVGRDEGAVLIRAGAGVVWHDFVMAALDRGWNGLENLSLIPGSTGAGPMQNIGAYGVELEERFHSLEAVEIATGDVRTFSHADCAFGYRESVFKRGLKGQYVITHVTFRLPLEPDLRLGYGAIREELDKAGITEPHRVRSPMRSFGSAGASCPTRP